MPAPSAPSSPSLAKSISSDPPIDLSGYAPEVQDAIRFTLRYASFCLTRKERPPVIGGSER